MSSILYVANTDIKRDLLTKAVSMYLSNLKCQLRRTKIGWHDKKTVAGKDGKFAIDRLEDKIKDCQDMLDMLREELAV